MRSVFGVFGVMVLIFVQPADQASTLATNAQHIANRPGRLAPVLLNAQLASARGGALSDSVPSGRDWRISTHWAGYVVTATQSFTRVHGSWVQPRIRCDRPESSAAFWVGLGGAAADSRGLEQIGTSADCSERFLPSYSAWYELIPAGPIELPLSVAPGDTLSAEVSAHEQTVTLAIRNLTTGRAFSSDVLVPWPDLASAEWIAEAPWQCIFGECRPLPLANFGKVTFTGATATTGAHDATISDPAWATQPIKVAATSPRPSAIPSTLSTDGTSFSVIWRDAPQGQSISQPRRKKRR